MIQGLTDDWRVRLAFPIFRLIDFLLSRQRVARFLFNNFRTKDNLRKVLQVAACATFTVCMLLANCRALLQMESGFGQGERGSTSK